MVPTTEQRMAVDAFYRDANTLLYGDNKPSDEAVDRLISKLNHDVDKKAKFSCKRRNEDESDITYVNERNSVFNKKIARSTTNTLPRLVPASSVELHYSTIAYLAFVHPFFTSPQRCTVQLLLLRQLSYR
ncbi:hypothetical protein M404DRAFT_1003030 [Pisolithus tinctorius Marx 270]|uniref:Pre-mRNA-splicing factor SYF2 n=1 Tax=Pisolithus tinctorius Marx 270 TaxID=870435 RepID=A0A0C3IXT3_PISTI|nr:hypothetical protein M404DRAFT_1003030 [Pisolithus tinctorius Marx 270]